MLVSPASGLEPDHYDPDFKKMMSMADSLASLDCCKEYYYQYAILIGIRAVADISQCTGFVGFLDKHPKMKWGLGSRRTEMPFVSPQMSLFKKPKPAALTSKEFIGSYLSVLASAFRASGPGAPPRARECISAWALRNLCVIIGFVGIHYTTLDPKIRFNLCFLARDIQLVDPDQLDHERNLDTLFHFAQKHKISPLLTSPDLARLELRLDNMLLPPTESSFGKMRSSLRNTELLILFSYCFGKTAKCSYQQIMAASVHLTLAHVRQCFDAVDAYMRPIEDRVVGSIESAISYLVSPEITEEEANFSSRWFRQSPSRGDLVDCNTLTFDGFRTAYPEKIIDPVMTASHIKCYIRSIPGGLIPKPFQDILSGLLGLIDESNRGSPSDSVPKSSSTTSLPGPKAATGSSRYGAGGEVGPKCFDLSFSNCVRILLSLNPQRLRILQLLGRVAQRIFREGRQDRISPQNLATIIPVDDSHGLSLSRGHSRSDDSLAATTITSYSSQSIQTQSSGSQLSHSSGSRAINAHEANKMVEEFARWHHAWGVMLSNPSYFFMQDVLFDRKVGEVADRWRDHFGLE